eukprot:jgi/Mesvir1/7734/Mv11678-RA.1
MVAFPRRFLRTLLNVWPVLNLVFIVYLLSRRLGDDDLDPSSFPYSTTTGRGLGDSCGHVEAPKPLEECPAGCNGRGTCSPQGACVCHASWTGPECSTRRCPYGCRGRGLCLDGGVCVCRRAYAGADCGVDLVEMQHPSLLAAVGPPFDNISAGALEPDVELMVNAKGAKKYTKALCHSRACMQAWTSALAFVTPLLPREDYRPRFRSCAVVSSGKPPPRPTPADNTTVATSPGSGKDTRSGRKKRGGAVKTDAGTGVTPTRGEEIDKHTMVLRLDNAPTTSFEHWVGSKTTHRLVMGDYARMVHSMLGTEVISRERKSLVTASTWWAGGYPSVEKVAYILAVPGQMSGSTQLRPPEHNGYAPFAEVFPGNKRFLLSPVFIRHVAGIHERVRRAVVALGMGCFKESLGEKGVPPILLATVLALQLCDSVDLYGAGVNISSGFQPGGAATADATPAGDSSLGASGSSNTGNVGAALDAADASNGNGGANSGVLFTPGRRRRDGGKRVYSSPRSGGLACCYYPKEAGYSPELPLCDVFSRVHVLRMLADTGRLRLLE